MPIPFYRTKKLLPNDCDVATITIGSRTLVCVKCFCLSWCLFAHEKQ